MTKKKVIAAILIIAASIAVLILLLPIEKNNQLKEKYGRLYENAQTDEKSKYILDNVDKYPQEILDLYYKSDDYLDVVYGYFEHKNDYQSMSYTAEEIKAGTLPKLYMSDYRWCYETVGGDMILCEGCVPVSLTMSYIYLTGKDDIDPVKISKIAENIGAIGDWGGISDAHIVELADKIGLSITVNDFTQEHSASEELIKNIIDEGHVAMLGMVGETFGGHAVVVREVTDGGIYINDSADEEYTEKLWSFSELQPEIYYVWYISLAE